MGVLWFELSAGSDNWSEWCAMVRQSAEECNVPHLLYRHIAVAAEQDAQEDPNVTVFKGCMMNNMMGTHMAPSLRDHLGWLNNEPKLYLLFEALEDLFGTLDSERSLDLLCRLRPDEATRSITTLNDSVDSFYRLAYMYMEQSMREINIQDHDKAIQIEGLMLRIFARQLWEKLPEDARNKFREIHASNEPATLRALHSKAAPTPKRDFAEDWFFTESSHNISPVPPADFKATNANPVGHWIIDKLGNRVKVTVIGTASVTVQNSRSAQPHSVSISLLIVPSFRYNLLKSHFDSPDISLVKTKEGLEIRRSNGKVIMRSTRWVKGLNVLNTPFSLAQPECRSGPARIPTTNDGPESDREWYITTSSHHATAMPPSDFEVTTANPVDHFFVDAYGNRRPVAMIGTMRITVQDSVVEPPRSIRLYDVLIVPGLPYNVLSHIGGKPQRRGATENGNYIVRRHNKTVYFSSSCKKNGNLLLNTPTTLKQRIEEDGESLNLVNNLVFANAGRL
ncbi:BQ2448_2648 [Microbotryum intermedium]|uniref:BQ2448_2648 protein n=1 Tax=Microbotryum intermedium TaxID=269621 RepID=A0A238FER9_9BASI|nr:BQ2448_2648 [Microbotryum intermedium]